MIIIGRYIRNESLNSDRFSCLLFIVFVYNMRLKEPVIFNYFCRLFKLYEGENVSKFLKSLNRNYSNIAACNLTSFILLSHQHIYFICDNSNFETENI